MDKSIFETYAGLEAKALLEPVLRDFKGRAAVVSSFGAESAMLLHMVAAVDPSTPVIFLDTGKHFWETLHYRAKLIDRLGLTDVRSVSPERRGTCNGGSGRYTPQGAMAISAATSARHCHCSGRWRASTWSSPAASATMAPRARRWSSCPSPTAA